MTPDFRRNKRGAVLPMVLGILLAVTLLLTSLLQMPGGVRRVAMHRAQVQQQIYDAESALIAHLEGFSEEYFALPKVERSRRGPWADLSVQAGVSRLHVLAGIACDSGCNMLKSRKLRREIYEGFKQQLNREITMIRPPLALKIKSGNHRLLGPAPAHPQALWVHKTTLAAFIFYYFLHTRENRLTKRYHFSKSHFLIKNRVKIRQSAEKLDNYGLQL